MKNPQRWLHASERPLVQHDGDEPDFTPENEMWLARIARSLLAVFGLYCHLLIIWLLSFPYTYFQYGICEVNCISITTGWQASSLFLLLPLFSYLMYLLSLLWKSLQRETWLATCLMLNVPSNLIGFLFLVLLLQGPLMAADLYNVAWHDAAYGIHLTLILLAVVASSVISMVLRSRLRRSENSVDPFR